MRNKMPLAREALILFLLSLPNDCKFNVFSIGSMQKALFEQAKSVPYSEGNVQYAIDQVKKFRADLGGLDILRPLKTIFEMESECDKQDYFLLTDGAVPNTDQILKVIEDNASPSRRLHTFGLGDEVDEKLIKKAAIKGFGHFYLTKELQNLDNKIIDSLT